MFISRVFRHLLADRHLALRSQTRVVVGRQFWVSRYCEDAHNFRLAKVRIRVARTVRLAYHMTVEARIGILVRVWSKSR